MVKTKELEFIPPKKRKEHKSKEIGKTNPNNNVNVDHITKIQVTFVGTGTKTGFNTNCLL